MLLHINPSVVLGGIISTNLACFLMQDQLMFDNTYSDLNDKFSIANGPTNLKMLWSMFNHGSVEHLLSNMVPLYFAATSTFIQSSSPIWRNGLTLCFIFFGSGLAGGQYTLHIAKQIRGQWDAKVETAKEKVSFKSEFLKWTVNPFLRPLASAYVHVTSAPDILSIFANDNLVRIGSSGGVFGVLSAYLFTSFQSSFHPASHRKTLLTIVSSGMLFYEIFKELQSVPTDLEGLKDTIFSNDRVDHTAHVGGMVFGFLSSIIIHCLASIVVAVQKKRIVL